MSGEKSAQQGQLLGNLERGLEPAKQHRGEYSITESNSQQQPTDDITAARVDTDVSVSVTAMLSETPTDDRFDAAVGEVAASLRDTLSLSMSVTLVINTEGAASAVALEAEIRRPTDSPMPPCRICKIPTEQAIRQVSISVRESAY